TRPCGDFANWRLRNMQKCSRRLTSWLNPTGARFAITRPVNFKNGITNLTLKRQPRHYRGAGGISRKSTAEYLDIGRDTRASIPIKLPNSSHCNCFDWAIENNGARITAPADALSAPRRR